jgi:tRNA(adenine34) deaminase
MCAGAILQSHVSTVVFGAYDAKSGAFGSRYQLATKNLKIIGGILEQECSSLLQEFFTNKR